MKHPASVLTRTNVRTRSHTLLYNRLMSGWPSISATRLDAVGAIQRSPSESSFSRPVGYCQLVQLLITRIALLYNMWECMLAMSSMSSCQYPM